MGNYVLAVGDKGGDYSGLRLNTAKLIAEFKTAGGKFVLRYSAGAANVNPTGFTKTKLITPAEHKYLTDNGIDIIANSEFTSTRITQGASAGTADGKADLALWKACGHAQGARIYVSWDSSPTTSLRDNVAAYLKAYDKALAGYYHVDTYMGDAGLNYMLTHGLSLYGWHPNAEAWSNNDLGYQPDLSTPARTVNFVAGALKATKAHIVQTGNYWFSKQMDEDIIIRVPVGSHFEALVKPTPPKPPAPKPSPVPPIRTSKEIEMLVVTVDRTTVPAGKSWPGDGLYYGGGIDHIEADVKKVSNINNLLKACGQTAMVPITYTQWVAFGGKV